MRKCVMSILLLCFILFPVQAYGMQLLPYPEQVAGIRKDVREVKTEVKNESIKDETIELDTFIITSGIDKDVESTFDTARNITGTAEDKTHVVIAIYQLPPEYDEEDDEPERLCEVIHEFTVGVSGIFSQVIVLPIGENHIQITASKDGRVLDRTVIINRKDMEIKWELEQGIALPGKKVR